ncbi:NAD(P)H-dependent oxidoreductase [Aliifodinibius sp. S!AR15-10]|uniref:NADPH-dependent FMN reductase n=1 Tax=Aliifodinibius sp. S!AR15-10 TaxID=2950437 RepID=UPI0028560032|nr:NADPH-dependent FMN reductase [Aliifodinibius sp. S!AR15-10]MDR8391534.1 NAD(P)H-dependent oxidoreductase [Aliifodinibius sp. S!AR15-10]
MAEQIKILGFAGSLRKGSYNKSLIRAAIEVSPNDMEIEFFDLGGIPLYNADVEADGDPGRVKEFKQAIEAADGLLIATPEYNHGVPAVTKNAIDWASRPPKKAPLNEKPVGILGASPGMTGSARGQSQLRQAFEFTNSYCMPQPEILVYRAHEKFDEQGNLTDERTREYLGKYLESLYDWILKFKETG